MALRADTRYINGKIYTMREEGEYAEAFCVKDGKILAIGSNEEMKKIPVEYEIDFKQQIVFPGFIDTHQHTLAYAEGYAEVDLRGVKSVEEMLDLLREKADKTPEGHWVKGSGFNQQQFKESRLPTIEELDSVSTKHPILVSRYCMHVHVANSLALQIAGIDENTVPLIPDSIGKDNGGKLTGLLRESAVTPLLKSIPDLMPTMEEKKEAIYKAICEMNAYGITGFHPIQGKFVDAKEFIGIYQDLEREGRLNARVYVNFDEYPSFGIKTGFGNEKIKYGFFKIYADGSLGPRTAALTEEYSDDPGNYGLMNNTPKQIKELCKKAYDQDLQVGIHAIGDRGIEAAVDAMEACYYANPKENVRFRLIHCLCMRRDLIERLKKLPVVMDIQPRFTSNYNIWWSEERLGVERAKLSYAWKTLIDEGFILTGSSDSPVEPFDVMLGVYSVVCRQDLTGKPEGGWHPKERVSVYEALCMYTKNAAYASFEEDSKGTLEKGKFADFVVLEKDPFFVEPAEIRNIKVMETYLAGKKVYER